jgi:hypothetical protein
MIKKCVRCNQNYETKGHKMYCSDKCQNSSKRERQRIKWANLKYKYMKHPEKYNKQTRCIVCGKEFMPDIRHPTQRTCSKKCCNKAKYEVHKEGYLEKCKERYNLIKHTQEYKEKSSLRSKKWREQNRERAREIGRRYKQRHWNEILSKLRKYDLKERSCVICKKTYFPDKNHPLAECCSPKCRNKRWRQNNLEKCKIIEREKSMRYRIKYPEKIKEQTRRAVESGKAAKNAARWRIKNPKKVKEIQKRSYWNNRLHNLQKMKDYRNTENGKKSHRASERNRRFAKRSKLIIDFPLNRIKQEKIIRRDNYTCVYCKAYEPKYYTLDHIIPQEKKGTNSINNLVVCCRICNSSKRHEDLEKWLESNYCKEKNIDKNTINPIVFKLLEEQKLQKKIQSHLTQS